MKFLLHWSFFNSKNQCIHKELCKNKASLLLEDTGTEWRKILPYQRFKDILEMKNIQLTH